MITVTTMKWLRLLILIIVTLQSTLLYGDDAIGGFVEGQSGTRYYWEHQPFELKKLSCEGIPTASDDTIMSGPFLVKSDFYGLTIAIDYDTNQDGQVDFIVIWPLGNEWARFYWVDLDNDGLVDIVFKDNAMDGTCDSVVVDYSQTSEKHKDSL